MRREENLLEDRKLKQGSSKFIFQVTDTKYNTGKFRTDRDEILINFHFFLIKIRIVLVMK